MDLPSDVTATTVYYRLDGAAWKTQQPERGLQQFGIELPEGRSAALETQIYGYANRMPCSLGNATGGADLDGGSIRELTLNVTPTTQHCHAAAEPADFPPGKMVVWASAPDDVWLAGTGGKILHWNGSIYEKVALPETLPQPPPDWNAIVGSTSGVWFAGTKNSVLHWASGVLSAVQVLSPMVGPTDWRSIAIGSTSATNETVFLTGSNRILGVATVFAGLAQIAFSCGATTPAGELTAVGCPFGGTNGRCFFVTDRGGIAAAQINASGQPQCRNMPSPTTKALQDVFVGVNLSAQTYDVRIVGNGGVALRAAVPIVGTADPNFMAANSDYSSFLPPSARVDLNRLGGSSIDELWIAGQGGVLLRWQNTPIGMTPTAPFVQSPTGLTADLFSLSGVSNHLFVSGANHALSYTGPLFPPR